MTDADLIALYTARTRARQDILILTRQVDAAHSRLAEAERAINLEMERRLAKESTR